MEYNHKMQLDAMMFGRSGYENSDDDNEMGMGL